MYERTGSSLLIAPRRTLVAHEHSGLLPDLGELELRPAGNMVGPELLMVDVPLWRGDAVWLDLTLRSEHPVEVAVRLDGGPENTCVVPSDPWFERCRRRDGSTTQLVPPEGGVARLDVQIRDVYESFMFTLRLIDAAAPANGLHRRPTHEPLEPIDYAQHNVAWPFD